MSIAQPYLLFLGDVTDPIAAKTARGIALWRPETCKGQLRLSEEAVSLDLPELSLQQAKEQGVKTLVIGTANARLLYQSTHADEYSGVVTGRPKIIDKQKQSNIKKD